MKEKGTDPRARLPLAFHYPFFVRLWTGSIVSSVGTQMNNVAKAWVLYQLTDSAAALGLEGLCFALPIAVLPLLAGPAVDRFDRLTAVKIAMVVETAEAAALAAAAATGTLSPWMIYSAAGVAAARLSFAIPAGSALVPGLVGGKALLSAQSLSAVVWSSSALIGPALGGLLLAHAGATAVFAVNGFCTLGALAMLRPVHGTALHRTPGQPAGPQQQSHSRLVHGFHFLRRNPQILTLQALVFLTSTLLVGTETLLPVLDNQLWHAGTTGYGLLRTAPGVAAVIAGLWLSLRRTMTKPFRGVGLGIVAACTGLTAFVHAPALTVGLPLLTMATLGLISAQILCATEIQRRTPDELRGAVGGITAISQSGLAGIAAAGTAVAASSIGSAAVEAIMAVGSAPLGIACATYAHRHENTPPTKTPPN